MANHGATLRRWSERIGIDKIEEFVDVCLSLENLIDPQKPFAPPKPREEKRELGLLEAEPEDDDYGRIRVEREYMEDFLNPKEFVAAQKKKHEEEKAKAARFPASPERDVLGFLLDHAPLERWERDVLSAIRTEAYYFWPQMQTKIMNEGWASYWHSRLMTEKVCDDGEIIEYAERNAGVMETGNGRINPYKLGVELYRHVEERWDKGQFGKEWEDCDDLEARRTWNRRTGNGRKKLFEVRALYNDVTFIDEFLTPDFAIEQKMFTYSWSNRNDRFEVDTREFKAIKEKLLFKLTNFGQPFIFVEDGNHENRSELYLKHEHQGVDLDLEKARETLRCLFRVWKRPAAIATTLDGRPSTLRYDGKDHTTRSHPPPPPPPQGLGNRPQLVTKITNEDGVHHRKGSGNRPQLVTKVTNEDGVPTTRVCSPRPRRPRP